MLYFRFGTFGVKKVLIWTLVLTGLWMGTATVVSALLDNAAADIRQPFFIQSSCQIRNSQQVHLEWTQVDGADGYRVRVCRSDLPGQCPEISQENAENGATNYLLDTYQETHVIPRGKSSFDHICLSAICRYSVVSHDGRDESFPSFSTEFLMNPEPPADIPLE